MYRSVQYEFKDGIYTIHATPFVGPPVVAFSCRQIAIAYDADTKYLLKHGPKEQVESWVASRRVKALARGDREGAARLVLAVFAHGFPAEEMNKAIQEYTTAVPIIEAAAQWSLGVAQTAPQLEAAS